MLAKDRWLASNDGAEPRTLGVYHAVTSFRERLALRIDTFATREAALEFVRASVR